jgi:hypothetical protein
MKTNINKSIVADNGSIITNASITINKEKRKSFWKGFFVGIISSVIASGIWYLVETYIIK